MISSHTLSKTLNCRLKTPWLYFTPWAWKERWRRESRGHESQLVWRWAGPALCTRRPQPPSLPSWSTASRTPRWGGSSNSHQNPPARYAPRVWAARPPCSSGCGSTAPGSAATRAACPAPPARPGASWRGWPVGGPRRGGSPAAAGPSPAPAASAPNPTARGRGPPFVGVFSPGDPGLIPVRH